MKGTRGRTGKGILFFCVFTLILLTSFGAAGGPQKEETVSKKEEINAVLSVWGYGYKVKVVVNGTDLEFKGGMSESKRLFDKDNEMAAQATPDIRKKNFVLLKGRNTISVEYTKNGADPADRVEVALEVENYPEPVFKLVSKKPSGKVEKTIAIQGQAPADFKPVTVSD